MSKRYLFQVTVCYQKDNGWLPSTTQLPVIEQEKLDRAGLFIPGSIGWAYTVTVTFLAYELDAARKIRSQYWKNTGCEVGAQLNRSSRTLCWLSSVAPCSHEALGLGCPATSL